MDKVIKPMIATLYKVQLKSAIIMGGTMPTFGRIRCFPGMISEPHRLFGVEVAQTDLFTSQVGKVFIIDKLPVERLAWVLMKLDSDRRNETDYFTHKFMGKIERAFSSLPRPIEWRSFFDNDLQPYTKMSEEVKEVAVEHKLKKSQAKALQKVKEEAPKEIAEVVGIRQPAVNNISKNGQMAKIANSIKDWVSKGKTIEQAAEKVEIDAALAWALHPPMLSEIGFIVYLFDTKQCS